MNKLSPNGKLLAAISILPLAADLLEDSVAAGLLDKTVNQQHVKNLVYKIRRFDRFLMDTADTEAIEQQITIQTAFRQFLDLNFSEDE